MIAAGCLDVIGYSIEARDTTTPPACLFPRDCIGRTQGSGSRNDTV
jgi:hypothetical protein